MGNLPARWLDFAFRLKSQEPVVRLSIGSIAEALTTSRDQEACVSEGGSCRSSETLITVKKDIGVIAAVVVLPAERKLKAGDLAPISRNFTPLIAGKSRKA